MRSQREDAGLLVLRAEIGAVRHTDVTLGEDH